MRQKNQTPILLSHTARATASGGQVRAHPPEAVKRGTAFVPNELYLKRCERMVKLTRKLEAAIAKEKKAQDDLRKAREAVKEAQEEAATDIGKIAVDAGLGDWSKGELKQAFELLAKAGPKGFLGSQTPRLSPASSSDGNDF